MKTVPALLTAAALVASLPAAAQTHRPRHDAPYPEGRSAYAPPAEVCIPLCARDTSPCDPPYFKAADGRCDYPMIGR